MFDESWENIRAEAQEFKKNKEETLLNNWLYDIGCKELIIGYFRNSHKKVMEIYSTRVGALIGLAGANVKKLEEMLSKEFYGDYQVKFIEVRGGFLNYVSSN